MGVDELRGAFVHAERLWSRNEVLAAPSPVPTESGIYAWYFRAIPDSVEAAGCRQVGGKTLLYIGIAPSRESSRSHLRKRIQIHYRRNASSSTLRRSLGVLLANELGLELRRHGRTERLHFGDGEARLSAWMSENAFVTWTAIPRPWLVEPALIRSLPLPLNIDHGTHPFSLALSRMRQVAAKRAEVLPLLP